MFRHRIALILACAYFAMNAASVSACGFIVGTENLFTIRHYADTSEFIVFGHLEWQFGGPVLQFVVESTIRNHPILGDQKVFDLPERITTAVPGKFLVFGEVVKGKINTIRTYSCSPAILGYVKEIMALNVANRIEVMRFCFNHLDSKEPEVANDAFTEFLKSQDPDIRKAGMTLRPEKLRRWLQDPSTPREKVRLYGFLLGNCGSRDDAALLRKLLDKRIQEKQNIDLDGVLTGYVLLDPKEGWEYIRQIIKQPTTDFVARFSAFRAIRYLDTNQPEIVVEKDRLEVIGLLLEHDDFADFPMDLLRQKKCWKFTDQILAMPTTKKVVWVVRRSILRYALQCPDPRAARYVAQSRQLDAEFVADVEEMLALESSGR